MFLFVNTINMFDITMTNNGINTFFFQNISNRKEVFTEYEK